MSPINLGNVTRVDINGVDSADAVTDVDVGKLEWLEELPDGVLVMDGFWDVPFGSIDIEIQWCQLAPEARCLWLKTFYPKFYARLRRMRHEYHRKRRRW